MVSRWSDAATSVRRSEGAAREPRCEPSNHRTPRRNGPANAPVGRPRYREPSALSALLARDISGTVNPG
jgi:hypothetical protein